MGSRPIHPSPGPIHPSSGPIHPSPEPIHPTPGPIHPSSRPIRPSPGPIQPTPGPIHPSSRPIRPSPGPIQPSSRPIHPSSGPIRLSSRPQPEMTLQVARQLRRLREGHSANAPGPDDACFRGFARGARGRANRPTAEKWAFGSRNSLRSEASVPSASPAALRQHSLSRADTISQPMQA
jgi:hypothetical protein